jgi:hypothetical protein
MLAAKSSALAARCSTTQRAASPAGSDLGSFRDRIRSALLGVADRLSPRGTPLAAGLEAVPLPLPPDAFRSYIDVIRGSPTGEVWVLGTAYSRSVGELHFACRSWGDSFDLVTDMPPGSGVSGSPIGPGDTWFAGRNGATEHYNGTRWTRHVFVGYYFDFVDVFARAGSDVWLAPPARAWCSSAAAGSGSRSRPC